MPLARLARRPAAMEGTTMIRELKTVTMLVFTTYAFLGLGGPPRLQPVPGDHVADTYLHEQDGTPGPDSLDPASMS